MRGRKRATQRRPVLRDDERRLVLSSTIICLGDSLEMLVKREPNLGRKTPLVLASAPRERGAELGR
jgi:hypothetical protein